MGTAVWSQVVAGLVPPPSPNERLTLIQNILAEGNEGVTLNLLLHLVRVLDYDVTLADVSLAVATGAPITVLHVLREGFAKGAAEGQEGTAIAQERRREAERGSRRGGGAAAAGTGV